MPAERTTRFKREAALRRPVTAYLRSCGFDWVAGEIPFYDRSIDLYAVKESSDWCMAVELKLEKWRRALAQALVYQLCADVAILALPERQANGVDLGSLAHHGVGLLAVRNDGTCEERLRPSPAGVLREDYKTECKALGQGKARWRQ